jgi:hypothetical protein
MIASGRLYIRACLGHPCGWNLACVLLGCVVSGLLLCINYYVVCHKTNPCLGEMSVYEMLAICCCLLVWQGSKLFTIREVLGAFLGFLCVVSVASGLVGVNYYFLQHVGIAVFATMYECVFLFGVIVSGLECWKCCHQIQAIVDVDVEEGLVKQNQ